MNPTIRKQTNPWNGVDGAGKQAGMNGPKTTWSLWRRFYAASVIVSMGRNRYWMLFRSGRKYASKRYVFRSACPRCSVKLFLTRWFQVERIAFSLCLVAVLETYDEELLRIEKSLEKKSDASQAEKPGSGVNSGATPAATETAGTEVDATVSEKAQSKKRTVSDEDMKQVFDKIIQSNSAWLSRVIDDAVVYAQNAQPRADDVIERVLNPERWKLRPKKEADAASSFAQAWQSLKNRGWKAETPTTGENAGKTRYEFEGKHVSTSIACFYLDLMITILINAL
jgi:hypothetical protein